MNIKKIGILILLGSFIMGCTNTRTVQEQDPYKRKVNKTAFVVDTIVATAIYNNSNFGYGKSYTKTKGNVDSISTTTQNLDNGMITTTTKTKSSSKSKSKGFGIGL